MVTKKFKLSARVNSSSPSAVKPVLERIVGSKGILKVGDQGLEVEAELEGESARELNRMILSELRRVEKKTSIRAEYTSESTTERFFDYVPKTTKNIHQP